MALLFLIAAIAAGVLGYVLRHAGYELEGRWVNGCGLVLLVFAFFAALGGSGRPRGGGSSEYTDIGPFDTS